MIKQAIDIQYDEGYTKRLNPPDTLLVYLDDDIELKHPVAAVRNITFPNGRRDMPMCDVITLDHEAFPETSIVTEAIDQGFRLRLKLNGNEHGYTYLTTDVQTRLN